jgi:hypothetical protein
MWGIGGTVMATEDPTTRKEAFPKPTRPPQIPHGRPGIYLALRGQRVAINKTMERPSEHKKPCQCRLEITAFIILNYIPDVGALSLLY